MELMMGGKMAPIPSLFSKCWSIHSSQALSAFRRQGNIPLRSTNLRPFSMILKRPDQSPGGYCGRGLDPTHSSLIPAVSGTEQEGLQAQMTDNGTTIARVQADIS